MSNICRHRSLEVVGSDEVKSIVRCVNCKEVIGEWSKEHLQHRMDTIFGQFNIESEIHTFKSSMGESIDFLRELTEDEREELR